MLIHKSGGLSNVGLNKHLPSKAQIEHGRTEVYFYLLPHSRAFNNHDTVHILETFLFKITNMGALKFVASFKSIQQPLHGFTLWKHFVSEVQITIPML